MRRIACVERRQLFPHGSCRGVRVAKRLDGFHAPATSAIAINETTIHSKAFAGHKTSCAALFDNLLEQRPINLAVAKPAIAVLGEGRMVGHGPRQPQPAEPAIGQIEMDFIAQLALRADA